MAAGIPVISTALGAEGLDVAPGHNFLLAEQDSEWLPALTEVAQNPARARQLAQSGIELVRSRYDWGALGEKLLNTYERWAPSDAIRP